MLISATGMGLVPLFSRWGTRTDMFDGTAGLNAGDSVGALMAVGRMTMGLIFFVALVLITHKVGVFKKLKVTPAIILGGVMIGLSLACYVTATLLTSVANSVLFIYTGPVLCILFAADIPQGAHVDSPMGMLGSRYRGYAIWQQHRWVQRVGCLHGELQP